MKVIEPGHRYEIESRGQELVFMRKRMVPVAQFIGHGYAPAMKGLVIDPPRATVQQTDPGTTNEEVLEVLIDRTKHLNGLFPCEENERALHHMGQALYYFNARTHKRQLQGVEGKLENHT